ncbi:hypothetical protein JR316_0005753 [Psilocybe cubensis]|uniref:Uncharacterized protein n=2 Tax=Psilocybe cubensis TaxID=181762 RepID=A0ACB8H0M8_PSICU|nr:hypothetical protein JR316_0005753 [Psilocybe cubensis]KAH9481232.1 hypothetical protein JR316_0005753 [Psilocybe cubensis]
MQSLLSPSESNAFQSFLSSLDYPESEAMSISSSEWALYSSNPSIYSPQDSQHDPEANPEHREALTKATKDLMSLDSNSWDNGSSMMDHQSTMHHQRRHTYGADGHTMSQYDREEHERLLVHQQQVLQHQRQHRQQQQQEQQRHNSFSSSRDVFPFLNDKPQQSQELQYPMHPSHLRHQVPPMNTVSSSHSSPTSPQSPYGGFHQSHNPMTISVHPPQQVHIPHQQQPQIPSGSRNTRLSASRSTPAVTASTASHQSIQSASDAGASSSSHPRLPHGMNDASAKRQRSSTSPPIHGQRPHEQQQQQSGPSKQTLLSPSQKKANHIQSEQKRRANIRRGYEALCETVPALREAIREEEEAERNLRSAINGNGPAVAPRKKSRKKNAKDGEDKDKDRLDGRAGPRSENVVLSKTIDHIQALLSDRSALLARLHRARSSLPPGHPALTPILSDPPWEREWKGGEGKLGCEDPDGEGVSEDDGEDAEQTVG